MDHRSDLYSLGVVLYTMLTRKLPFWDRDTTRLLDLQQNAAPPPIRIPEAAPSRLDAICLKLLENDPNQRFSDARELMDALSAR
jgi:eukaryotic-like serine/threonine-protein kinase